MKEEYKEYYMFLEALRRSGKTNMFGATPYLEKKFNLDHSSALEILTNWMSNYSEIKKTYYKEL